MQALVHGTVTHDDMRASTTPGRPSGAHEPPIVTLQRYGAPPLRLKASAGPRLECALPCGERLYLRLYFRPGGGAALAFSRITSEGVVDDAVHGPELNCLIVAAASTLPGEMPLRPKRRRMVKARDASQAARRLAQRSADAALARRFREMLADLDDALEVYSQSFRDVAAP